MMEVWSREAGSGPAHADASTLMCPRFLRPTSVVWHQRNGTQPSDQSHVTADEDQTVMEVKKFG